MKKDWVEEVGEKKMAAVLMVQVEQGGEYEKRLGRGSR